MIYLCSTHISLQYTFTTYIRLINVKVRSLSLPLINSKSTKPNFIVARITKSQKSSKCKQKTSTHKHELRRQCMFARQISNQYSSWWQTTVGWLFNTSDITWSPPYLNFSHSIFSPPGSTCDDFINTKNHFSSFSCRKQYSLLDLESLTYSQHRHISNLQ